jgi:hypothetical protein
MAFDAAIEPEDHDRLLIQKARDRISQGWCQRQAYNPQNNGVCFIAALNCAVMGTAIPIANTFESEVSMIRLANKLGFTALGDCVRFNDWADTTKADVLERFDTYLEGRPVQVDKTPDYMTCCNGAKGGGGYVVTNPGKGYEAAQAAFQALKEKMRAQLSINYFADEVKPLSKPKSKGPFNLLTV